MCLNSDTRLETFLSARKNLRAVCLSVYGLPPKQVTQATHIPRAMPDTGLCPTPNRRDYPQTNKTPYTLNGPIQASR